MTIRQTVQKGLRQGDVLLVPVAQVSGERLEPIDGRHILAEGEQTGHHHYIPAGPNIAVFRDAHALFVQGNGRLFHQEHSDLSIDGTYEVVQQRQAAHGHPVVVSD
jgi:hypothetical protein